MLKGFKYRNNGGMEKVIFLTRIWFRDRATVDGQGADQTRVHGASVYEQGRNLPSIERHLKRAQQKQWAGTFF